ncbi:hypothetical protein FNF29_05327 [Cafeteria roenbergensis]|uniref:Uncharacterized protein n=1 Tax=Cafeteria roenbergensis TaxID=33653 RepID=A0A5A8CBL3_CAFRO|nr:hypothetical protein FNF29_05327 [Cafeteria roenbergensis]|eukprot:KAA0150315.1 hypothetical protein FNF29_05327 [Cafeteria roenbergensis]
MEGLLPTSWTNVSSWPGALLSVSEDPDTANWQLAAIMLIASALLWVATECVISCNRDFLGRVLSRADQVQQRAEEERHAAEGAKEHQD